jgi:3-deoxy-7-phosphoheptulonate synthase
MIVTLKRDADPSRVLRELVARGLWVARVERARGGRAAHYVIAPHSAAADPDELARIEGILDVTSSAPAWPLVERQGPVVGVGGVVFGGGTPVILGGPCSIESEAHVREVALALGHAGVAFLRGGAFKPRTSPYAFQGHGAAALGWMRRAADEAGMKVVTEVMSEVDVPLVAEHADLVQVGSRNMQNFALLKAIGRTGRPALLKRGMAATLEEWLLAGEHLLASGSSAVVFCERGVRGFDESTRNLLDLGAVALVAHVHRAPVVVDPSHGAGRRDLVMPLARASLAAGAAGVMIETHDDPGAALSDGPQALPVADVARLASELRGGAA